MSNEVATMEQTESRLNVINYNPVFPTLMAEVLLDLPVEDMSEDILKMAVDTKNYPGGWTTYFDEQNLDNVRGMKALKEAIYGVSTAYCRELKFETNYDKCGIKVWANVMRRDGHHPIHAHPKAIVAGTFYVRVDDQMSPISFRNPTAIYRSKEPIIAPQDLGPFTSETLVVKPKVNTMVVWPAWLEHEVTQMNAPGPRISISFSVDYLPVGA